MRAFIALDFGEEVKEKIYEIQQKLKPYTRSGRFTDTDNFHLTLKFLDEIDKEQRKSIDETIRSICVNRPLNLEIGELGFFKGEGCIPVLWLGFKGDTDGLYSLQKEVSDALIPIGFAEERRKFIPHITIGKNIIFNTDFKKICYEIGKIEIETNADSMYLFSSEQVNNKWFYTIESEYKFQNSYHPSL